MALSNQKSSTKKERFSLLFLDFRLIQVTPCFSQCLSHLVVGQEGWGVPATWPRRKTGKVTELPPESKDNDGQSKRVVCQDAIKRESFFAIFSILAISFIHCFSVSLWSTNYELQQWPSWLKSRRLKCSFLRASNQSLPETLVFFFVFWYCLLPPFGPRLLLAVE